MVDVLSCSVQHTFPLWYAPGHFDKASVGTAFFSAVSKTLALLALPLFDFLNFLNEGTSASYTPTSLVVRIWDELLDVL